MNGNEYKEEQIRRLGARIRAIREERGYTNAEKFAYQHNISRSQYARYERGEDLRFSSLLNVLQALDISLSDFFKEGF